MPNSVHGFHNLPELFGGKAEFIMGFTHKNTAERLDKFIQCIWHYQQLNNGDTPKQSVIANELGFPEGRVSHYLNLLIKDDRIERISARPWRVRILEHPKNRAAIRRLQKALDAAAAIEAQQRAATEEARTPSAPMAPTPPTSIAAQIEPVEVAEISIPTPEARLASAHRAFADTLDPQPTASTMNWHEAEAIIKAHGGNLFDIASSFIINTAKPGVLLEALLDRGYTVAKTNPRWKD